MLCFPSMRRPPFAFALVLLFPFAAAAADQGKEGGKEAKKQDGKKGQALEDPKQKPAAGAQAGAQGAVPPGWAPPGNAPKPLSQKYRFKDDPFGAVNFFLNRPAACDAFTRKKKTLAFGKFGLGGSRPRTLEYLIFGRHDSSNRTLEYGILGKRESKPTPHEDGIFGRPQSFRERIRGIKYNLGLFGQKDAAVGHQDGLFGKAAYKKEELVRKFDVDGLGLEGDKTVHDTGLLGMAKTKGKVKSTMGSLGQEIAGDEPVGELFEVPRSKPKPGELDPGVERRIRAFRWRGKDAADGVPAEDAAGPAKKPAVRQDPVDEKVRQRLAKLEARGLLTQERILQELKEIEAGR